MRLPRRSAGPGLLHHAPYAQAARAVLVAALCALIPLTTTAEPTDAANHLFNPQRTGYTSQPLIPPYHLTWTHAAAHTPRHAWQEPAWEVQRIDFDYAYAVSAGNGLAYYASSSDHAVHALDLATGETRWRFFTDGPVRLAPAVHGDHIAFSSDDGWTYCLQSSTGALVWQHRPRLPDERLIGNEQIISRWPARSGVLIQDGRAYTTFGMWSPEGIVISCLNADTGETIWENDSAGTNYMTQPHYEAMGGVSPQGYLILDGKTLIVPCGRAAPAFFNADTGEFLYHESEGLFPGGAWGMVHDDLTFVACEYLQKPNSVRPAGMEAALSDEASLLALNTETREEVFHLNGALRGVITDTGTLNLIAPKKLISVPLAAIIKAAPSSYVAKKGSSEGHMVDATPLQLWETDADRVFELIQAGGTLIAGGRGKLTCYDATTGKETWRTTIPGDVYGLLIVDDALLVSTTEGAIHCFRTQAPDGPRAVSAVQEAIPSTETASTRAKQLLAGAGATDGYGIYLGVPTAEMLSELARASQLQWCCPTAEALQHNVRERLADAGLYGTRVAIHTVTGRALPYTDYLANTILFPVQTQQDLARVTASDVYRVLRPCGGVAVITRPQALEQAVETWLKSGGIPGAEVTRVASGFRITRGPLDGAGKWTHQYADAGKSGASRDKRVRLPLKVLWFGSLGPGDAVSRHYRGPAPLALNGRMFVPGNQFLQAVDAYNGRILWKRELPGIGRWPMPYRGGSIAADEDSVYALQGTTCLRLDAATGDVRTTYRPPEGWEEHAKDIPSFAKKKQGAPMLDNAPTWEFLALTKDSVIGTIGLPNVRPSWWSHAHPANGLLFVLDKVTGTVRWSYDPESVVDSNAIAVEGEQLFLIDGLAAVNMFTLPRKGQKAKSKPLFSIAGAPHERVLKAFDLKTGEERWRTLEITPRQNSLYAANGVLLASVPLWHGLRATREGPTFAAFSTGDGKLLWKRSPRSVFPVIVGNTVYMPQACDLRTGEPIMRGDPLTGDMIAGTASLPGGCGRPAGSVNLMMKRSGSLGFYDLTGDSGVYHYPNLRASCWMNMVAACGLVLVPEGSSSCPCAYNYKTSIAFMPDTRHNSWGLFRYIKRQENARIMQLRMNLGAPGDKPDSAGEIWYAFPRPATTGPRGAGGMGRVPHDALPVQLMGDTEAIRPTRRNPDWTAVSGTDKPWLYTCGLVGPLALRIQLGPEGAPPEAYRVVLHMCDLDDGPARRAFSFAVQGKTILSNMTVRDQAGGSRRALTKTLMVKAGTYLTLEVVPAPGTAPVIRAIEIMKE